MGDHHARDATRGCSGGFHYVVQPGDTLYLIAERFDTSLDALLAANPHIPDPMRLVPGQVICVPMGGAPSIPAMECSMLLYRTAGGPRGPEVGGVARVFQTAGTGASVLVAVTGLPSPSSSCGQALVAWLRHVAPGGRTIKVPLAPTDRSLALRVWAGALVVGPGRQLAPFADLIVTAEPTPEVTRPNLKRIVASGLFTACHPPVGTGRSDR